MQVARVDVLINTAENYIHPSVFPERAEDYVHTCKENHEMTHIGMREYAVLGLSNDSMNLLSLSIFQYSCIAFTELQEMVVF